MCVKQPKDYLKITVTAVGGPSRGSEDQSPTFMILPGHPREQFLFGNDTTGSTFTKADEGCSCWLKVGESDGPISVQGEEYTLQQFDKVSSVMVSSKGHSGWWMSSQKLQRSAPTSSQIETWHEEELAKQTNEFLESSANLKSPFNRTKIIFSGRGRGGKTSTISSLIGRKFDKNERSTRGANIHDICIIKMEDIDTQNWDAHVPEENPHLRVKARYLARYQHGELSKEDLKDSGMLEHLRHLLPNVVGEEIHDEYNYQEPRMQNYTSSLKHGTPAVDKGFPKTSHVDIKKSFLKDEETVELERLAAEYLEMLKAGQNLDTTGVVLSLWDLGGQEQFSALHHEFMSPSAIYVVVFSLEELLLETGQQLSSSDPTTGKPNIVTAETKDNCLRELKQWLDCIFCFGSDQNDVNHAPVLVVGTCRDKFTEAQLTTAQTVIKKEVLERTPCWKRGMVEMQNGEEQAPCFFVDNTAQLGSVAKHASVEILQCRIQELTKDDTKCPHIVEKVPIEWLRVLDRLKQLQTDESKQQVTLEQVQRIAKDCKMGNYEGTPLGDEVKMMLAKFHQLGAVCWRSSEKLKNVVVLDPKWLIDAVTLVVRDFKLHSLPDLEQKALLKYSDEWEAYLQEGKVSAALLQFIYTNASTSMGGYTEIEFEMVKEMMTMFGLLVKVEGGENFYLPSLLANTSSSTTTTVTTMGQQDDRLECCFWFAARNELKELEEKGNAMSRESLGRVGLYPPGIFDRVLGVLLSGHAALCHKQGRRATLSYGIGTFILEDFPAENLFTLKVDRDWNPKWIADMVALAVKEVIKYSFAYSFASQTADLCLRQLVQVYHDGEELINLEVLLSEAAGGSPLSQAWNHSCIKGGALPEGVTLKTEWTAKPCPVCSKDRAVDALYTQQGTHIRNKMCTVCLEVKPMNCILPCMLLGTPPSAACFVCMGCSEKCIGKEDARSCNTHVEEQGYKMRTPIDPRTDISAKGPGGVIVDFPAGFIDVEEEVTVEITIFDAIETESKAFVNVPEGFVPVSPLV